MIAREGLLFVLSGSLLTIFTIWIANKLDSNWLFALSLALGALTLFTTYFFRDPERNIPQQAGILVAPADGKVVLIDTLDSHDFVGEPVIQVSIFLSIFDVHVNRTPCSGQVEYVKYNPGKFLAAFNDKASIENEQTEIGLVTPTGHKIAFKQIAGLIARRIVCNLTEGDSVSTGERFGMIRFGSRADLLFPAGASVGVSVGDRVRGGASIIGYLPTDERENAKGRGDA